MPSPNDAAVAPLPAGVPAPWAHGVPEIIGVWREMLSRSEGADLVILVDGLGSTALRTHRAHTRHLRTHEENTHTLRTLLPSSTASVLTSVFTARSPLEHGVLGYTVLDRAGQAINQLQGAPGVSPTGWLAGDRPLESVSLAARIRDSPRKVAHVGPARYAGSFLTGMLQYGWDFFGHGAQREVADAVRAALRSVGPRGLVYLHVPDLDKAGHRDGPGSEKWREALEGIDALIGTLQRTIGAGVRVSITSDHGMVAAHPDRIHDLAAALGIAPTIAAVAGEGRALMVRLHARPDDDRQGAIERLRDWVGDRGAVLERRQLLDSGVLGPVPSGAQAQGGGPGPHPSIEERLGDALIFARGDHQFTDTRFVPVASLAQKGVHGSFTREEMQVPLIRFET
ncbi:MAG: alkaline phosphatase family protein [Dermabacter sp.]|nr:alkaline phosphatase family protein [Dermabacter sp.]